MKVGTVFPIPEATANLGDDDCPVTTSAYYGDEAVDVSGEKLVLGKVGTYKLVYKAINSQYKTSSGNDSFSEYVVTIRSAAGENDIVKFRDANNVLPEKRESSRENLRSARKFTKSGFRNEKECGQFRGLFC